MYCFGFFKKHLIITAVVFRVLLIRKSCKLLDWLAANRLQALDELFCAHTSNRHIKSKHFIIKSLIQVKHIEQWYLALVKCFTALKHCTGNCYWNLVRAKLLSLLKDKISAQQKKSVMQIALTRSVHQRGFFTRLYSSLDVCCWSLLEDIEQMDLFCDLVQLVLFLLR